MKPEGSKILDYYQKWHQECQKLTIIMKDGYKKIEFLRYHFKCGQEAHKICDRNQKIEKNIAQGFGTGFFLIFLIFEIQRYSKCYLNGFWKKIEKIRKISWNYLK